MRRVKVVLILIILWLGVMGISQALRSSKTKVIFCDVGQGDGTIVINRNVEMVIDTGFDNGKMLKCLSEHLPFWDKRIEVLMISHWDSDHSGALGSILKYYKVDNLVSSQDPSTEVGQSVYPTVLNSGDELKLGEILFEVLSPGDTEDTTNDGSLVGILSYKDKSILFTGDASNKVEQRLVWRDILKMEVDVLKVSHHGSAEGTSQELLDTIKPKLAVISVGKDNKFGHPTKEVLDRLKGAGVEIRRTDVEGDVIFTL